MASPVSKSEKSGRTLVSWKEIAVFLNRGERTVKRWERERGLPVHRVPGGERGSVFAYPDELADWLKGKSQELEAEDPDSDHGYSANSPMPSDSVIARRQPRSTERAG